MLTALGCGFNWSMQHDDQLNQPLVTAGGQIKHFAVELHCHCI